MAKTGNVVKADPYGRQTVIIDSDLSDKYGYAVSLDTTDENVVNLLAAATSIPYPLVDTANGATVTTTGTIAVSGQADVKLGGTVAPGDKLTATTGGVWIKTTTDTNNYGAVARKVGVSGDLIPADIRQGMIAG